MTASLVENIIQLGIIINSIMQVKERITSQKKVILDYLQGVTNHPTAEEVYNKVRKNLPRISAPTIGTTTQAETSLMSLTPSFHQGPPARFLLFSSIPNEIC